MSATSPADVRALIVARLTPQIRRAGLDPEQTLDDVDLIAQDLVDSLGLLELLTEIEEHFEVELDFEDVDPEQITVLGRLCRIVAEQAGRSARA